MTNVPRPESPQPYRWMVLALTAACFLLTFVVRFIWPPLIPVVVPVLGMKMSQAGAYMSAFYIGYVITQIPAGILADYFGIRLILALSLALEGITTFAMGSISTYEAGFALRVATGLGAGAVFSACSRALMEWFPPKERGTAFGALLAAPSAGILLSGIVVPALNKAFSWQAAFQAVGAFTLAVGILLFFLLKTSSQARSQGAGIFGGFKVVFGSRDLILTALAGFCLMWVELGTATWTFASIKHLGYTLKEAGSVMVFYGIGGLIAPLASGYLSDKLGHRKNILMASLLVIAPVTVVFGYQTTIAALSAMGFVFGFVSYLANPHLSVMISEFAGKQWAATANGTSNFVFQLAPIIGPVVMGWAIDITGAYTSVWWIMAIGPLVGALLLIPVNPENRRD
ncbi:MAG: major facilitator superfamily 1 [Desulfacinum sp.]|jgi:sugar phosphate permease|nr:major facilitator superfamily 1 [Desulfacinum sp.]